MSDFQAPITIQQVVINAPITLARDAYQLAVADGFVGTRQEWQESQKGEPGTTLWGGITDKPSSFTPSEHASTHAMGGADEITPGSIGAATATQGTKADTALQPTVTTKTTPVDADTLDLQDSAASGARKLLSFANLKVWIKAWLDSGLTIAGQWIFTTSPRSSGTPDSDLSILNRKQTGSEITEMDFSTVFFLPTPTLVGATNDGLAYGGVARVRAINTGVAGNYSTINTSLNGIGICDVADAGNTIPLANTQHTFIFYGNVSVAAQHEMALIVGGVAATFNVDGINAFSIVFFNDGASKVKLRSNNSGTPTESSAHTLIGTFPGQYLRKFMLTYDNGLIKLYQKTSGINRTGSYGRWVEICSLSTTPTTNTTSNSVNIVASWISGGTPGTRTFLVRDLKHALGLIIP